MTKRTFETRDEYNRKPIAESIARLLESNEDITPLVINGGWGTGKSEFCEKLIELIKEEKRLDAVYIDAFQADHINEPLLTVISAIASILPKNEQAKFRKKAIPALKHSLKLGLNAFMGHVLRQDYAEVVDDFDKEIKAATSKIIDATIDEAIKDYADAQKNLEQLKALLQKATEKKKLVIFIDELDRCKPTYALEMLELLKHTFDIPGIRFVLVTNLQQMMASINHCYGQAVDAHRYLEKFIKFTVTLPQISDSKSPIETHISKAHLRSLINSNALLISSKELSNAFSELSEQVIDCHNYSLREVETLVRYIGVFCQLRKESLNYENLKGDAIMTAFGVITYALLPSLAESIYNGTANTDDIAEFLGVSKLSNPGDGHLKMHEVVIATAMQELNRGTNILFEGTRFTPYSDIVNSLFIPSKVHKTEKRFSLTSEAIGALKLIQ